MSTLANIEGTIGLTTRNDLKGDDTNASTCISIKLLKKAIDLLITLDYDVCNITVKNKGDVLFNGVGESAVGVVIGRVDYE